jgi:methylmalonyl-CoA mutase N-terminal domain/subunit
LEIDQFASRLSFFFNSHNDLFEEVAKYRAARSIWAQAMRERYGAAREASWKLRFHAQTAGCSLQDKQPELNLVRVAYQALAAVLGGCQSLHTNSMDETLALPSEHAVTLALRTQQVLAHETGVTNTVDPLGGSYFIETLTRQMKQEAETYFQRIAQQGGMIAAIGAGFFRREIAEAAFHYQRELESHRKLVVGVNAFQEPDEKPIDVLKIDESVERDQVAALRRIKSQRSAGEVARALDEVRRTARSQTNLVPALIAAAHARATVEETMNALADVLGRDPRSQW